MVKLEPPRFFSGNWSCGCNSVSNCFWNSIKGTNHVINSTILGAASILRMSAALWGAALELVLA